MSHIDLIRIDRELLQVLQADRTRFEARAGRLEGHATLVLEVMEQTLAMSPADEAGPWGGYLTVDRDTGAIVGTCAFKSEPDADGAVEIAYFTFPSFERRGLATAMAQRLIERAFASPKVRQVFANTLPEPNSSTRVLRRAGMTFAGEVVDPVDGRVWRWTLARP